jgi:hypothetical protein
MSRREATCSDASLECMVGWDPPLATFFAQVYDHTVPDPYGDTGLCAWLGASYGEIPTVADLAARIARWAEVDDELTEELERDQTEGPAWPRRIDLEALIDNLHLPNHFDDDGRRVGLDCPDLPDLP